MTSEDPTSSAVISAHRAWLEERIAALKTGARSAQEGMRVDGDHRPASRGERGAVSERGAMRAGLLMRVAALEDALGALAAIPPGDGSDVVRAGVVFQVDDGDEERWMAILPGGQGNEVLPARVRVVSPQAPIARALLGLGEGDVAEMNRPGGFVELEVVAIG